MIFLYALKILQYCFISDIYDAYGFWLRNGKTFSFLLEGQFVPDTMPKKGKKKSKVVDDEYDVKITSTPMVDIIYKDTKSVTEAEPEFKWGQIYHML